MDTTTTLLLPYLPSFDLNEEVTLGWDDIAIESRVVLALVDAPGGWSRGICRPNWCGVVDDEEVKRVRPGGDMASRQE